MSSVLEPAGAAGRSLRQLRALLHDDALEGPADAYWVAGSLAELSSTVHACLGELDEWYDGAGRRDALRACEGPFAQDPDAAVAVATDSLAAARAACAEMYAALERVQMATADLEPAGRRPVVARRRSFWRH